MSPFFHVKCRFCSTPPKTHRLFPSHPSFLLHPHRYLSSISSHTSTPFSPPSLSLSSLPSHEGSSTALDDVHAPRNNRHNRHSDGEADTTSTFPFSFYLAAALGIGGALTAASSSSRDSSTRRGSCNEKSFTSISLGSRLFSHKNSYSSTARNRRNFFAWRSPLTAIGGGSAACEERLVELGPGHSFEKGKLYEVTVNSGKDKVLVARLEDGKVYCVGPSCSHYSAPLVKGVLTSRGTVSCPWHDAEFDVKTGKCVNGPSLDAIPSYAVTEKGGIVYARLPETMELTAPSHYTKCKCGRSGKRTEGVETIAIVGGGAAAIAAAETLRTEGYQGRIVLISREHWPPYDRPVLTKNLNAKAENITFRSLATLKEAMDVEVLLDTTVTGIDTSKKVLHLDGKTKKDIKFDKVLLCTGSDARNLDVLPNAKAKGIFTLRDLKDHEALGKFLDEATKYNSELRVAIIGASFVGLELASAMKKKGFQHVTVIGQESVPFERVLGKRVGESLRSLLAEKGVKFCGQAGVTGFTESRGRVTGVELASGDIVQADVVLVGVGAIPSTGFLKKESNPSFAFTTDGGIITDPLLRVPSSPDIYVAGDIASYPYVKTGK
ncbi:pyridine nucleotide-disulfide oxidoreductase domain-containing protein, partial [Cystoisospora suis]